MKPDFDFTDIGVNLLIHFFFLYTTVIESYINLFFFSFLFCIYSNYAHFFLKARVLFRQEEEGILEKFFERGKIDVLSSMKSSIPP